METPPTDFDGAWKAALERHFEAFLELCFPDIHNDIDWIRPPRFLETELQQVAPHANTGKQRVDKLVEVALRAGGDAWILVHIEVQSQYDPTFPERMFRYHARLYDRYQRQVVSLAVLGDGRPHWSPKRFGYSRWDCELLFSFPVSKLLTWDRALLEMQTNMFATIVLSHRDAMDTQNDAEERARRKIARYRWMLQQGHTADDIRSLLNLLDHLLRLPPPLAQEANAAMRQVEEEFAVSYITSFEETGIAIGIEKGRAEGLQQGIAAILRLRFGAESAPLIEEIGQIADLATLEALLAQAETAPTLNAIRQVYADSAGG
jgi:predicted transposase YdaD